jgi:hypothetical protein
MRKRNLWEDGWREQTATGITGEIEKLAALVER